MLETNKRQERIAVVTSLLQQQGRITYVQRRELAERFGCVPSTIYKDMSRIQMALTPVPPVAPTVLQVSVPSALAHDRDIAILRLLGRLEFAPAATIKALVAPDILMPALWKRLNRLLQEGRIWRQRAAMEQVRPKEAGGTAVIPPQAPYVYGLTPEGLELLQTLEVESSNQVYEGLKIRDRRAPNIPQAQLKHDLLVSNWCASLIDGARRSRLLDAIVCQVEYVSARTPEGKEQQRFDAFIGLTFNREPAPRTAAEWEIPWNMGYAPGPKQFTVRFALEVDRGTEPLKILLGKGYTYRQLSESGHYRKTLGGEVLPVVVAPPGRRSAQIAREWFDAWPGGKGVISNFLKMSHPQYGALWGEYYTMGDNPAKSIHLLEGAFPDLRTWQAWLHERAT